jgi:hypothetical protein
MWWRTGYENICVGNNFITAIGGNSWKSVRWNALILLGIARNILRTRRLAIKFIFSADWKKTAILYFSGTSVRFVEHQCSIEA